MKEKEYSLFLHFILLPIRDENGKVQFLVRPIQFF